ALRPSPRPMCAEGAMANTIQDGDFICTTCPRIGRQCPMALNVARDLERAGRCARSVVPDFEMTGRTRLEGCARTCNALFQISERGVAIWCGLEPGADLDALARFADAFLDCDIAGANLIAPENMPLAFVLSRAEPACVPERLLS